MCFDKYTKNIKISSLITFVILILAGILGGVFLYFPPQALSEYINQMSAFYNYACIWFVIMPLIGCLCLIAKNRSLLFISNVFLMLGIMLIATVHIFPMITKYGQSELETFSKIASRIKYGKAYLSCKIPCLISFSYLQIRGFRLSANIR